MSEINPKLTFISKVDACNVAEPFGEFQYQDAQGDVRHEFANAVIARHERIRAAAPELLEACIKTIEENGHLADGDNCTLIHLLRAIKKATGETP